GRAHRADHHRGRKGRQSLPARRQRRTVRRGSGGQGRLQGMTADEIVERLGLQRHPEGGWYKETFRDQDLTDAAGRAASTAIYYLLPAGERSAWHRVMDAAEVWHFYAGAPLALSLA